MMADIEYQGSHLKVSGEAQLADDEEFEHGAEMYVIGRVRVGEVSFPEKNAAVRRVHVAKMKKVVLVNDSEAAEAFIAKMTADRTGQGTIYDIVADEKPMERDELVAPGGDDEQEDEESATEATPEKVTVPTTGADLLGDDF